MLENVAMSLTISGIGKKEREEMAKEALIKVGLEREIKKRPNQLSGGQMQRVSIARALVNNPDIILADEPTGALDSETGMQVMELLKEVSGGKLVIMVTHNAELAEKYASRIVRLSDGALIEDTNPYKMASEDNKLVFNNNKNKGRKKQKVAMSFWTAIKLSFQNLRTKKGRTIITSIAGSIGIIGVALVLSISSGMGNYVERMQKDTLSGFPITISQVSYDFMSLFGRDEGMLDEFTEDKILYPYDSSQNYNAHINGIDNDYLEYLEKMDKELYNSISYTRLVETNLVIKIGENYKTVNNGAMAGMQNRIGWQQLPNTEFLKSQYDLIYGDDYPMAKNDIALVVDERNSVNVELLEELGIDYEPGVTFPFNKIIGKEIRAIPNDIFYTEKSGGLFAKTDNLADAYNNQENLTLTITSILRIKENSNSSLLSQGLAYTDALVNEILDASGKSDIVVALKKTPEVNVLTGAPLNENQFSTLLKQLGGDSTPIGISIYPVSFGAKDNIKSYLDAYNEGKEESEQIVYSDMAEMISDSMSTMINAITLVLTAIAAISLVVSTIMIGIIIYVSVVERTKEIGILRSIGARKKDITRVFSAESIIIGFFAGIIGVVVTYLLSVPINAILKAQIGVSNLSSLPIWYALALLALSMLLTFIGGILPSLGAAKKDPVAALRTE